MHKSIAFEISRRNGGETPRSIRLRWCIPQAFRSESKPVEINRRLYLESPIGIQRLLIVPYKLGTIVAKNNRQIQSALQRVQDNNNDVSTYWKTIATKRTIRWVRTITVATGGRVSTETIRTRNGDWIGRR